MKRALVAIGLTLAAAPAYAQIPVTCTSCPTMIQQAMEQAKSLAESAKQVGELVALKDRATATYNAMTNIRDLGSAVGALQMVGIQNPLPINPYAASALMNGTGTTSGMLSNIGALYQNNLAQNGVYTCTLGTWACEASNRWFRGSAGAQALNSQAYTSAADRAPQIAALQAQIESARTPAEREAIIAQLTAANAGTMNQLVQVTAMGNNAAEQRNVRELQSEQRLSQSIAEYMQEARARGYAR